MNALVVNSGKIRAHRIIANDWKNAIRRSQKIITYAHQKAVKLQGSKRSMSANDISSQLPIAAPNIKRTMLQKELHRLVEQGADSQWGFIQQLEHKFRLENAAFVSSTGRSVTFENPEEKKAGDFQPVQEAEVATTGKMDLFFTQRPIPLGKRVLLEAKDYADYYDIKIEIAYNLLVETEDQEAINACIDEIVLLINNLIIHPDFSERHQKSLLGLYELDKGPHQLREVLRKALLHLYKLKKREKKEAAVEWIDGEYAVCRFEHPIKEYGTVEREFVLAQLPEGIMEGDGFALEIDLDTKGRPLEYRPVKHGGIIAKPENHDNPPEPQAPTRWTLTQEEREAYDAEVLTHMQKHMKRAEPYGPKPVK